MLLTWGAKPYNPAKESNAGPTKKAPQRAAHRQTRRQQTCRPRILGRDFPLGASDHSV